MPAKFEKTSVNQVTRVPERGRYDRKTIYPIIDEALICHVGLVEAEQPVVIPTLHVRKGDEILLHGATTSRLIKYVAAGHPVCVAITLVDGLVLARSVYHHSVNYRSVVLFGRGRLIAAAEKLAYLEYFTNRLLPDRWAEVRPPNEAELKATAVVSIPIELASAKVRMGPPGDEPEDMDWPVWAGVLPIRQQFLPPQADPQLETEQPVPDYIVNYVHKRNNSEGQA